MPIVVYVVQPGDTVYSIARRYGVTPQSIIESNNLAIPDRIQPGQKLQINVRETEPQPNPPDLKTYIVQAGDTLSGIAQKTGVTVAEILALNNIADPNRINIGQRLLLPARAQLPTSGQIRYTIKAGDTLYALARRYQMTVTAIMAANPGIDPTRLQIGQVIIIPGAPPAATPVFQGNPNRARVALTFDATYGDNFTSQILTILEQYGAKSTWFISGIWAENFPDLLRAVNAAGHEIGNHSQTHPHMTELSSAEMSKQIQDAGQAIQNVIGRPVNLFRPPFGEYNQTLLNVAARLGYRTIMWTIDSLDWQDPGPQAIVDRVLDNLKNGAIILMHNAAADTAEALPTLLDEIIRRGYVPVSVSEVL